MKTSIRYLSFVLLSVALLVSCSEESGKSTKAPIAKVEKPEKKERPDLPAKSDTLNAKPVKRIPTVLPPEPCPDPLPGPWPPEPDPWPDPYPFPEPPPPMPLPEENINRIVDFPDVAAEFPGGPDSLMKFIRDKLVYPEYAKELGIEGRVFVQFVVEKDGSMTNLEVLRGVSPELDNEAKRIIRLMPKWIPATSNGESVRSKMIVPFKFSLE